MAPGRAITIFSITPTIIFFITNLLENLGNFRPHGNAAFTMISYGIVSPGLFLFLDKKLLSFAIKEVKLLVPNLNLFKRKPLIHPIM
jgi:hypothetical protein